AGIGLLVTLLTTVGVTRGWELFLYGGSFFGFGAAVLVSLSIFHRNSTYIERAIHRSSTEDPVLLQYDKAQMAAFLFGVAFFAIIGVVSASYNLNGESAM